MTTREIVDAVEATGVKATGHLPLEKLVSGKCYLLVENRQGVRRLRRGIYEAEET